MTSRTGDPARRAELVGGPARHPGRRSGRRCSATSRSTRSAARIVAPSATRTIVNVNVPAVRAITGGPTTGIGVDSNGYIVVGGGTAEDNNCCTYPADPDAGTAEQRPGAVLDRPRRHRAHPASSSTCWPTARNALDRRRVAGQRVRHDRSASLPDVDRVERRRRSGQDITFAYAAAQADPGRPAVPRRRRERARRGRRVGLPADRRPAWSRAPRRHPAGRRRTSSWPRRERRRRRRHDGDVQPARAGHHGGAQHRRRSPDADHCPPSGGGRPLPTAVRLPHSRPGRQRDPGQRRRPERQPSGGARTPAHRRRGRARRRSSSRTTTPVGSWSPGPPSAGAASRRQRDGERSRASTKPSPGHRRAGHREAGRARPPRGDRARPGARARRRARTSPPSARRDERTGRPPAAP